MPGGVGVDRFAHVRHRRGGRWQVGERAARGGGEHRGTQRDRLGLGAQMQVAAGDVSVLAQQRLVARAAAGHHHAGDPMARRVQAVDDVARAIGQGLDRRQILARQRVLPVLQRQPGDHSARQRIGPRGAIAVVVRQHVQVARRFGLARLQRRHPFVSNVVDAAAGFPRGGLQRRPRIVLAQRPIDQGPGRALAALVQPPLWQHGAEIRTPDARHHDGLAAHREMAARGAADDRQPALGCGAKQCHAARVRVDDAGGNDGADRQAKIGGGLRAQASGGGAKVSNFGGDQARQVGQADGVQQSGAEVLLVRQIVPLARQGANTGEVGAGRPPDHVVCKIKITPDRGVAIGEVPAQPQDLRQFHFDADLATDIGQGRIVSGVDRGGFGDRAMIHPHDDVACRIGVLGDRNRGAFTADRDQRAGSVEADPTDGGRRNARLGHSRPHRGAGLRPDVARRLLEHIGARIKLQDRPYGERQFGAGAIEHAGAHAAGSHVDADKGRSRHAWVPVSHEICCFGCNAAGL